MRIGIDIRSLQTSQRSGVGEYTYHLVNELLKQSENDHFVLFSNAHTLKPHVPQWDYPHVTHVHRKIPNKILHSSQALLGKPCLDTLMREQVDHMFFPNIHFGWASPETKTVLTVHDLSFEIYPEHLSRRRRLWHRVVHPKKKCQQAHLIVVPSENTKRDIVDLYGIDQTKIHVIYPGIVDQQSCEVKEKYNLPEKYLLFLGTIEPRKNVDGVIKAFTISKLHDEGYELVIAGAAGWGNTDVLSLAEQTKGVRMLGYVPHQDKAGLLADASAFVFPSFYEGFGFPPLEALAQGTPTIVSNRSSLPEVCGDTAVYVDPYSLQDMAHAMREAIATDTDQKQLQRKAQAKKYSWKNATTQFRALLQ